MNELLRKDRIKALEYVDEHVEEFDIWLLNFKEYEHPSNVMMHKEYVFQFYREMQRVENIDMLLSDDGDEEETDT